MVCDASRSSHSQEIDPFHRSVWQSLISQQCGQSATLDEIFPNFPAMFIAALVIRNIQLRIWIAIAVFKITGDWENIPSRVADQPHCCNLEVPAAMVCDGSKSFKMTRKMLCFIKPCHSLR